MNDTLKNKLPSLEDQVAWWNIWNTKNISGEFDALDKASQRRGEKVLQWCSSLQLKSPKIFEVGCGTGWLCEKLVKIGDVTGIDLSNEAIDIARKRVPTASFVAGDVMNETTTHGNYNLLITMETIFYVENQPAFVNKIASLLEKDGYLLLTAVNKFVFDRRDDIGPPGQGQIRKWLTLRQIKFLLNKEFTILSIATVLPAGNLGILRIVNSHKVNRLLELFFSKEKIESIKEKLGLGQSIIIMARKK